MIISNYSMRRGLARVENEMIDSHRGIFLAMIIIITAKYGILTDHEISAKKIACYGDTCSSTNIVACFWIFLE